MKDEQIKTFGKLFSDFCGVITEFGKKFSEVTGDAAPEVKPEDKLEITEEVPTPAPVEDPAPAEETPPETPPAEETPPAPAETPAEETPPSEEPAPEEFAEDEEIAEVKEDEVNKDIDSIKDAVDEVAESDVEESAKTLKKAFSKVLESRDKLFASPTRKNFSEMKDSCDKLFSAAGECKTYSARMKAKKLFDCIKFFADTVEEVLTETEAPAPVEETPGETPAEEPVAEDFAKCDKCGKDPCVCPKVDDPPADFDSPELDEAVESFADTIPEGGDQEYTDFCGGLMNFACVAKSKDDADRKIRLLKAFSNIMGAPVAETDAAKQDEVDPEVAEEMKKTEAAEAKVTNVKLVEFSKLLRQSAGISKEVIKSFSSLMAKFAEEEEAKAAEKAEEKPAEDKKEETPPTEEPKNEETPPPAPAEETPPAPAPAEEAQKDPAPTEETPAEDPEDSEEDDDEEVVIEKTEVANFSQSGGDAYGEYMKKMLLR